MSLPPFFYIAAFFLVFVLSGCAAESPEAGRAEREDAESSALFVDVTEESGIDFVHQSGASGEKYFPEMAGGGGGFMDYDGDGWMDILLVNGKYWDANVEQPATLQLYRNTGDGQFEDVTLGRGLDILAYGMGMAAADYDNDGDTDLLVTAVGPNYFFRNEGGVFVDVTNEAGLHDDSWSTSAMFFDYDNDGWLDLFVANYVEWTEETDLFCSLDGTNKAYCTPEIYTGQPSRLYRNLGNGSFEDVSLAAGIDPVKGKSLGVALLDLNEDGWLDFAVANDTDPDFLYRNEGDGTFEEIGLLAGFALDERGRARAGMGIDVGITDDSGEETIFVGNFSNEMVGVYRDLGGGSYLDRASVSKIGRTSLLYLTFGLFLFDYDLDFDLDLFVANGHVQPEVEDVQQVVTFKQRPLLFNNRNDGTFDEVGAEAGSSFETPVVGRGAAYADYDRDGDLDILLMLGGDRPVLLQNRLPEASEKMVQVELQGTESNRDGIGALVVASAGGRQMSQRVRTGSSYLSQSELLLTFGAEQPFDTLLVHWPSGLKSIRTAVQPGSRLIIKEGEP